MRTVLMALRRHTHAWRLPISKSSLHRYHIQVQAALCRQPQTYFPLPVGEGKTRHCSEQKFVPREEALTLTLSHGRGDGFAANPKKQPAP